MGSYLIQDPVIGFFCRSPLNNAVKSISCNFPVIVTAVGIAAKLLLVFPNDTLSRHIPVIRIDPADRKRCARLPAVKRSHHNASLSSCRKLIEILAVFRMFRIITVIGISKTDPALNAVHPAESSAVRRQYKMLIGNIAVVISVAGRSVAVISHGVITGRRAVRFSVRTHNHIPISRTGVLSFGSCKHACRKHPQCNQDAKER